MKYHHEKVEAKWQQYWAENQTFAASNNSEKPKYYVLDMFPYPSGAGLHVGHPLGYIASDIVARYKRHKGFNVLHPQGYDSFGLPAEQYAIQTGQHPEKTTRENIARYREQLDRIGFSFDWSREVRTSNADYYKYTQWIFIQLFNSWYNKSTDQAEDISTLISIFEKAGNATVHAVCDDNVEIFFPSDWSFYSDEKKQQILLQYRLTYLAETEVNWCPALGTVLANDEIVNGVSERGGHPVIRKKMTQWSMRISAYAERLLQGLNDIDWSESIKESQRNWIGKSVGASVDFRLKDSDKLISVFTTRPDTIFGVTFMTLAPEHELVSEITTPEQKAAVDAYVEATAKRSERERMADVKTISGVFTGAFVEHPFTREPIPVWIGDYVLAGYGTGAVMAVPCGDERDYAFANFFKGQNGMPEIKNIFNQDISQEAFGSKEGFELVNSNFLNGMGYKEGTKKIIEELEKIKQGKGKTNYRLRDAVFSRQRYWGEPFPVYYVNGLPQMIDAKHLPIVLPEVEKYLPTEDGQPPLGNATDWAWDTINNKVVSNTLCHAELDSASHNGVFPLELNTMPGWAGSSWYWMRYMDAHNSTEFASADALKYWENVDLYIGGSEHATGHLLYSRFWNKFLKDKGFAPTEEPFKKLINQGMILGMSAFVYRVLWKIEDKDGNNVENLKGLPNSFPPIFIGKGMYDKVSKNNSGFMFFMLDKVLNKYPNSNDIIELSNGGKLISYFQQLHVDLAVINDITNELDIEAFKKHPLYSDYKDAEFILEDGKYIVGREVEKMSKSKYNVVNPDDICNDYGADTLRLYEMFLGPLEQAKPWNTAGITGVSGFLKKLWRLYFDDNGLIVTNDEPTPEMYKSLHKTIKKVTEDIENFSFNTSVSQFMICVNELAQLKCNHRKILEPLAIVVSPYAPHIAEELWSQLGHEGSVATVDFPVFDAKYLVESEKEYPVSFNGKMRFTIKLPLDLTAAQIEEIVMTDERTQAQLQGRTPNKVIIVPGKIINLVG
ncbi:leucine--tRNA ligase [Flavobacterium aquatile]|uniref:Leucine--tRNA ligase n=1 Tax=Flavobacterium aquatile LMG 4008 = ATCC 11947 TaxID=1453498 RepID=A0A095UXF5_9FLAO|nr:class I tRNA ligase family protein [Flavobacterium aquatile]KGD67250.1 leucyl-tRNA synthetase [Flavobacterium aquatile LMG 4008 = ATCC 11947]OXA66599.1 leucine--tRNA ligase [Flavobacterium aquatile] [Flavobacterium aquatile LMG 4008 = ATCC 11947]GEC78579.1 leucine--tRNA ligase [Flavobacterium aquatile]